MQHSAMLAVLTAVLSQVWPGLWGPARNGESPERLADRPEPRERTEPGTLVAVGPRLLFLGQTSGELRLVHISPEGYQESLRTRVFTPEVISITGPTVAGGRVYLRNLREMAAFSF